MEPKKPKSIDQQWEEVCQKASMTPRELYQLAVSVFFSDTNRKKDVLERMNMDFQEHSINYQKRQLQLFEVQLVNENMQSRILEFKLNKRMNRMNRSEKIKAWFAKGKAWIVSLIKSKPAPIAPAVVEPKPQPNDTSQPSPQV